MGLLFSKKKSLTKKEVLESLETEISQLGKEQRRTVYQEKSFIGYLLILSLIAYLVGALIFYIYYSPRNWLEYGLYSIPLVLFPFIVYLVKKLLNMYFAHKKAQYDQQLTTLRAEKRKVLNEVMESETFNVARELLQKFDPLNPLLRETRETRRDPPQRREQNGGGALRQRRPAQAPHPALRQQPHPLTGAQQLRPHPLPQQAPPTVPNPSPSATSSDASAGPLAPSTGPLVPPAGPQAPSAGPQAPPAGPQAPPAGPLAPPAGPQLPSHHTTQFIPPGMCLGPAPGPPSPSPILPRERTSLDKMVEYLVGDGPNNRYALICSNCHSHNGMSLGDEFEYISFRCAYCYTFNPARRQKQPLLRRTSTSGNSSADAAQSPAVSGETEVGGASVGSDRSGGNEGGGQQELDSEPAEVRGQPTEPTEE